MVSWALKTPFYSKKTLLRGHPESRRHQGPSGPRTHPVHVQRRPEAKFSQGPAGCGDDRVVRIHSSSGTTGIPTVIYYTRDDVDRWTDLLARSIVATGASAQDIFQNMMSYGLFTGGLGLHYGAERVGMAVIPIGGGNTKRQIQTMKDFQTTVQHVTRAICCTSTRSSRPKASRRAIWP
jgi:phenylacetate-CoA ligase